MDDFLLYEDNNYYDLVNSEDDSAVTLETYSDNLRKENFENGKQNYQPVVSVSNNYVTDDNNSSEVVSVNSIVPDGTIINNNYNLYVSENQVSENGVSYNIINKPLNEYNTQEGLTLLSCFMLFVFGFVLIVRKGVLPWN